MLWLKFVDNVDAALAADDLVVGADLLDACTHFHADHCSLYVVNDTLLSLILMFVEHLLMFSIEHLLPGAALYQSLVYPAYPMRSKRSN